MKCLQKLLRLPAAQQLPALLSAKLKPCAAENEAFILVYSFFGGVSAGSITAPAI